MKLKLFDEQIARHPNNYPWTEDIIKSMWTNPWTPYEFNFKSDLHDFRTILTEQEQGIIVRNLSAIGQIEIAVKKFWSRLGDNLPHPSITDMGLVMANVEVVHNKAYEKLLQVLGLTDEFEKNLKLDIISGRVKYLRKYLDKQYKDNKKQYIYSLVLFTLFVENVSLFSQFYTVFWFGRNKNCLKDTNNQVLYTTKEELIHGQAGTMIINTLKYEYPELFDAELEARVLHEAEEAFKCESKIIDWIIGDYNQSSLNADVLKEYVKQRINESLEGIGYKKLYKIDIKLAKDMEWMDEEVLGNIRTDFFFKKPTEYSKNTKSFKSSELF